MDTKEQRLKEIQEKITHVQSAYSNMTGFDAWGWSAYKVEAREKDAVIDALGYYLRHLRKEEEELHDNTELRD